MTTKNSSSSSDYLKQAGFGKLPDGWNVITLKELLAQERGISVGVMYPGGHDPAGIPLIKAGDLTDNRINPDPDYCISMEKHVEYKRTELEGGELLLSLVGQVGLCSVVPATMAGWNVARAVAVIRLKDKSDAEYVRLCLLSKPLRHLMDVWSTTTVQMTLNLKEIRELPLPWPPKEVRTSIAIALGRFDKKIEVNREINNTLEKLAKAVFQEWFIDFGPVKAKAHGHAPIGISEDFAKIFPSAFDESGNPIGWPLVPLTTLLDFNPQDRLSKGQEAPYLDMSALSTTGALSEQPIKRAFNSGTKFRNGDTLLARITPCLENGKTSFVQVLQTNEVGWGSTEFIVMRPKENIPQEFAYLLARFSGFREHAILSMTGTSGRQRVQTEALARFSIVRPPDEIFSAFGQLVKPWFSQITANALEIESLIELRDLMVPKLMSGEIVFSTNSVSNTPALVS